MKKILIYPYYANPYQTLLYTEVIKDKNISLQYLRSRYIGILLLLDLPWLLFKYRLFGFRVFHLHWVSFTSPSKNIFIQICSFIYTVSMLIYIKILGYKLIWTIHNITPHEKTTINDLLITKILCFIANKKIVHSAITIKKLQELNLSIQNIVVIPHGSYIAYYPNTIRNKEARHFLSIKQNDFVFLFFGELKLYKGIDDILNAFMQIELHNKNVFLLIVGKIYDQEVKNIISKYQSRDKHISFFLRHINDEDVQYFMRAADIVVYAFKKITTSGSVLLALSFGKTIIYPQIGTLQDLPNNIGFPYNSSKKNDLYQAMKESINASYSERKSYEKNAYQYAQSLSWEDIGKKTKEIYMHL